MAQGDALTDQRARHLLRRTGFGATPDEIAKLKRAGSTVGDAADQLVGFKPKGFKPGGKDFERLHSSWVNYMTKAAAPLNEKLTLFWHDHFATGFAKVLDTKLMGEQNKFLRLNCKGSFKDLVKGMNKNAATMEYLDTPRNHKDVPNENYGRELQELFTLGVKNLRGGPDDNNYTQDDVRQIARAFTGWDYDRKGVAVFHDYDHDTTAEFPGRGAKEIYASTGGFASPQSFASPEGDTEIDQVVDIIFAHRDWQGQNTVARRTAKRLFEFFTHGGFATIAVPSPELTAIDEVIANSSFTTTWSIEALVREILVHDRFYDSLSDPSKKSVKWPIDFAVGSLKMLKMKLKGRYKLIPGGSYNGILTHMENMGQTVLDPPSVFGWDWEASWISSATMLARCGLARDVAAHYAEHFAPLKLISLSGTDPDSVVDAVTEYLGVKDDLATGERDALKTFLGGNLNTADAEQVRTKLHGLFVLVMQSPAYQLH